MLQVDVAKLLGFKDSYLFLIKNPKFPRLVATEEDRQVLAEQDAIPSQLKNRTIALVTARSVFRKFGYKIIKRGKSVRDDYYVGDREEAPEPSLKEMEARRILYQDMSKASSVEFQRDIVGIYTNFPYRPRDSERTPLASLVPLQAPIELQRDDWMCRCALSAAEFNRSLAHGRPKRFWDPHTNMEHVPAATQPKQIHIEAAKSSLSSAKGSVANGIHFHSGTEEKDWVRVDISQECRDYPLALAPGQRQFAFSVYSQRFSVPIQDLPLPAVPVAAREPSNANDSNDDSAVPVC